MASAAVLASGNGSNFEAIVRRVASTPHEVCCLVGDRKDARVFSRSAMIGIPWHHVTYYRRDRTEAEEEIIECLEAYAPDLVVLAGFMRILSGVFLSRFPERVVNIHPSLLPAHPGTGAIAASYASTDASLGVTIHRVDDGVDTGAVIRQVAFGREDDDTLARVESRIHEIEHETYPDVVVELLDEITTQERVVK